MATSPLFAWRRGDQAGPYREPAEELQSIAHAARAARDAWREKRTKAHADGSVPGLDDAGLQAMRHALVDAKGLFELGDSLDGAFPAETRERLTTLAAERDRTEALRLPAKPAVLAVRDAEKPADLAIHARGDHTRPIGEPIARGVPRILAATLAMPAATVITTPPTPTAPRQSASWISMVQRHWVWPSPPNVKPPSTQPRSCSQAIHASGAAATSGHLQPCTSRRAITTKRGR